MKHKMNWMILACIIPIIVLVTLPFFGFTSSYLRWGVLFICFLMMLFMMSGENHCGKSDEATKKLDAKEGKGNKKGKCH